MKLANIYLHLKSDITKIEAELELAIQARHPILREASTQLLKAGGKRIRPVFVLLGGQFGDYSIESLKHIAVPLELIHMASLVHDDVIDDAELRRGQKTIKSHWDNRVAMYTGDYMFARAVEKALFFDNPDVHRILSLAMKDMCIGEVEQIRDQYNWDQNLRMYLRRIRRKTALLIAVSCQLGGVAAGAPLSVQSKLYSYGYNVGMSFQITDDILDFVSTEKQLGKPAGSDLKQGNVTLPALYAMEQDPEVKELIVKKLNKSALEQVDMKPLIEAIKETGSIEYSKQTSDRYLQKAYHSLEGLPNVQAKKSLYQIAKYIGNRSF